MTLTKLFHPFNILRTRISSSPLFNIIMSPVTSPTKSAPTSLLPASSPPPCTTSSSSPPSPIPSTLIYPTPSTPPKPKPPHHKPYLTISIDGNISSGKSTLVSTLTNLLSSKFSYGVETMPEPLEKWTNVGGHNLLDMLYKDTVKNNFIFQHYVQLTRLVDTLSTCSPPEEGQIGRIRVMERSIQNNRYCFSELAHRQGTLHPAEFSVIAEWYAWLEEHVDLPLDLIIYLRTEPSIVFERMQNRGRSEEATVPLKYLSDLHETYEDWLIRDKIVEEGVGEDKKRKYQVLVLDANQSKEAVGAECTQLIADFLEKHAKKLEEQNMQKENDTVPVSVSPAKKPKLSSGSPLPKRYD